MVFQHDEPGVRVIWVSEAQQDRAEAVDRGLLIYLIERLIS